MNSRRAMRTGVWCALCLHAAWCAGAELKIPVAYRAVVDLAGAAPPEFGADALLRVVETGKVADAAARVDLLGRAFELAGQARERFPRRWARGQAPDTLAAMRMRAYELKLDALSLRMRAVTLMLRDNKQKAREMFQTNSRPVALAVGCEDLLAPDFSAWYATLASVVSQAYTAKERAREEHVNALIDAAALVPSVWEIAAAEKMAAEAGGLSEGQRNLIGTRLRAAAALLTPAPECGVSGVPVAGGTAGANNASPAIPDGEALWRPGASALLEHARKVRFGALGKPEAGRDPSWQDDFAALRGEVAAWRRGDETELAFYHEKATIYEGLMDVAGADREGLLSDFVDFVASSPVEREEPVQWFSHVPVMIARLPGGNRADEVELFERFARSGNAALTLYAALEKAMPPAMGVFH